MTLVPARRKRHIACDELFHFIAKLIARSFCYSSLPNRNRFAGLRFGCRPAGGFFLSNVAFFISTGQNERRDESRASRFGLLATGSGRGISCGAEIWVAMGGPGVVR